MTLLICFLMGWNASAQNIGGIGAMLNIDSADGYTMPRILKMVPASPAAVSLKEGWYILTVNGTSCKDKNIQDVVGLIRGEVGTHVILSVADNKQGKNATDKDMMRIILPQAQDNTVNTDNTQPFYDWCEGEAKQLRKQRHLVVKTFNSECGDYFFNFNADTGTYHLELFTMEAKAQNASPGHVSEVKARIFDNRNESAAIWLKAAASTDMGDYTKGMLSGDIHFSRPGVGVVSTTLPAAGAAGKCMAMYIVVYK